LPRINFKLKALTLMQHLIKPSENLTIISLKLGKRSKA